VRESGLERPRLRDDLRRRALGAWSQGQWDSARPRVCESLTERLGFDRAGILRKFQDEDSVEAIAAHGWPLAS
jgi:hypothetical protein